MQILTSPLKKSDLKSLTNVLGGEMVKAVVDVENSLLGLDAEMYADIEQEFLARGSSQDALWGVNLWFDSDGDDFIEYDSMINLRPRLGNRSRDVEDPDLRDKIKQIVDKWIE